MMLRHFSRRIREQKPTSLRFICIFAFYLRFVLNDFLRLVKTNESCDVVGKFFFSKFQMEEYRNELSWKQHLFQKRRNSRIVSKSISTIQRLHRKPPMKLIDRNCQIRKLPRIRYENSRLFTVPKIDKTKDIKLKRKQVPHNYCERLEWVKKFLGSIESLIGLYSSYGNGNFFCHCYRCAVGEFMFMWDCCCYLFLWCSVWNNIIVLIVFIFFLFYCILPNSTYRCYDRR